MDNHHPDNNLQLAQQLALCADILRDISARGNHYSTSVYDLENYRKIQDISLELLSIASAQPLAELEPMRDRHFVHMGPLPVGDAAIIDKEGRILLIRRSDNKRWAMPGGGLEVGETPAQGVVREALEETGYTCEPLALVGINDSRFCGFSSRHHLYHFTFLCRLLTKIEPITPPSHANEILGMDWFPEHALPPDLDPGHALRIPEAFRVWHGDVRAYFDR